MIFAASKPANMYTREFIKSLGLSYGHFGTLDYFAEGENSNRPLMPTKTRPNSDKYNFKTNDF